MRLRNPGPGMATRVSTGSQPAVQLLGQLSRETELAIFLIETGEAEVRLADKSDIEVCLPKSRVKVVERDGGIVEVTVPGWLYKKKKEELAKQMQLPLGSGSDPANGGAGMEHCDPSDGPPIELYEGQAGDGLRDDSDMPF